MTTLERYFPPGLALFLRGWVRNPRSVGAVAPSGQPLATLMTRAIQSSDRVIEFGPGTGTFTRSILGRGVDPKRLALIESNSGFAALLRRQWPDVAVVRGDASAPHSALESFAGQTDVIVSGLPLVLFEQSAKSAVLTRALEWLRPGGSFYQFTYGGRCPVAKRDLSALGLEVERVGLTLRNLPPAFVYRLRRCR